MTLSSVMGRCRVKVAGRGVHARPVHLPQGIGLVGNVEEQVSVGRAEADAETMAIGVAVSALGDGISLGEFEPVLTALLEGDAVEMEGAPRVIVFAAAHGFGGGQGGRVQDGIGEVPIVDHQLEAQFHRAVGRALEAGQVSILRCGPGLALQSRCAGIVAIGNEAGVGAVRTLDELFWLSGVHTSTSVDHEGLAAVCSLAIGIGAEGRMVLGGRPVPIGGFWVTAPPIREIRADVQFEQHA